MTTRELQDRIIELKKEKDVCILAHAYQSHDIWEVADYIGDSYGLSVQAAKAPQKTILMCGVRFMAETCKILSPEKRVLLANSLAGCPMAMQINREQALEMKKAHPGLPLVAYINTTASLKTVCDVVVTSSSAVRIIRSMPENEMLFVPDCNLGGWIQEQIPEKKLHLMKGGCPTHMRMTARDVKMMKAMHPHALVLVHPECLKEVVDLADYVGSTTGIMKYAKESDAKEFIIGTEASIVQHLQFDCPDKRFYVLSKECVCHNMKMTTLVDVLHAVEGTGGDEITLPDDTIRDARKCIDRMIELGG
ncbi:MAG: quinolinate synthase NadA [Eubacteriales bacterium]|jgi:quinolinate synthase|nr:quinolinate synthase NadA [Lachnospiraceae bacterium]MDD5859813.1 quinolinate synthase NadA [Eubacteriales bacterium]MCH4064128.1 quinolinate synthase NadA [Lachnospiraceae bacterium]MCH4103147.1 quinolinate synthase NadA [Lachnospiraceae bacterium]MCI1309788.1 quinolinate synthase NadA [Lachnospiraceae bacterium]